MGRMADLDAELRELPDDAKDFMQGFYRGRAEGIERERERINNLLADEKWHDMVIHMTNPPKRVHSYDCVGCRQIALINGENN